MKTIAILAALCGSVALAGCSFDQAQPYVAAGCAVGQIALATAQANIAAVNSNSRAAKYVAQAQALAPTDCTAALAMIEAAKAAAAAPPTAKP